MDKLEEIFRLQEELNDRTFKSNNIMYGVNILSCSDFKQQILDGRLGPNDLPNLWLQKYLWALKAETQELEDELLPKWWSKDVIDLQNIRVEVVDLIHFVVSLCLAIGINAEDLANLYMQKHKINEKRQEQGYNKENKTEDDNKTIK